MRNGLIIETRNLSYSFGRQQVLDKVSLKVPEGSIYGFLGPNGAGKTTTIKILRCLLDPGERNVFVFGGRAKAKPYQHPFKGRLTYRAACDISSFKRKGKSP